MPRFHVTWGTGPAVVAPFARRIREAGDRVRLRCRHRVDELVAAAGTVTGVRGAILEPSDSARGTASSRNVIGDFELTAQAVIVTSGGIGGNHDLVRRNWPARLGRPPRNLLSGVPEHVDGRMLDIAGKAGGNLVNGDRMWHYTEGIANWDPIWPRHGIRILPGPSSLWLDARGQRLPVPLFPGFDTLGTLEHIMGTGFDYTWFVLDPEDHREGVRALRFRAEPGPDRQERAAGARPDPARRARLRSRRSSGTARTSWSADTLPDLVAGMNRADR